MRGLVSLLVVAAIRPSDVTAPVAGATRAASRSPVLRFSHTTRYWPLTNATVGFACTPVSAATAIASVSWIAPVVLNRVA